MKSTGPNKGYNRDMKRKINDLVTEMVAADGEWVELELDATTTRTAAYNTAQRAVAHHFAQTTATANTLYMRSI